MNPPNPKRLCRDVTSSIQNPNSVHVATEFDSIISSFILLSDSLSTSMDCSLDRVLGQVLSLATKASGDDSIRDFLIDRTRKLALSLQKSTKRVSRMRRTYYPQLQFLVPPLAYELTIKIFSMLETHSLMNASVCCTMFRECSLDPLCYSHIDLTTSIKRISVEVVCSLILRAGKELRSLQLGRVKYLRNGSLVTRSCLASIILNRVFNGGVLRSLHLYNLKLTTKSLCNMLLVCPNLTDLKIFNLKHILVEVLKTLTKTSHSILDRLFLHNSLGFTASGVMYLTAEEFVSSCPNLTSLTLEGFEFGACAALALAEGFLKLNYMNLSTTPILTGRFLRDLIKSCRDTSPLKTLILRDCPLFDMNDVEQFLVSLIKGDFKFIGHIDVSREHGYGCKETVLIKNLLMKLKEERSDVTVVV